MRTHTHYESDGSEFSETASVKSTEFNNNKVVDVAKTKRKLDSSDSEQNFKKMEKVATRDQSQSYTCPVCDRNDFDSIQTLEAHLEDNHPDYPAKCNVCRVVFPNNKLLSTHKAALHGGVTKQVLGFKDLTFVDFSSEKFPHIARFECEKNLHKASSGLKFQCKRCPRAFPCSTSLEIHEKECGPDNGLDLTKTNVSRSQIQRNEFFSRLNLQDNSPVDCKSEASTKLRQQLLAKVAQIDNGGKDLADIQSILSTANGSLLQQLQTKSEFKEETKPEDEESQDLFAVEFRKMKLRGEFPCRLCTAVFPNLRALKGHNRAHLNGNNNGMYRCNMCPHSSMDKAALIRHMRTHNGDRPYECSLCNYAFTTKANCERHLRNRHAKTTREEVKKSIIYHPSEDPTNDDLNKLTKEEPKIEAIKIDVRNQETLLPKEMPKEGIFSNISDIIRSENLKSLKEHKLQNGYLPYDFTPTNVSTPQHPLKIQVKNLDVLKEPVYPSDDDEEEIEEHDEPMNLVLDLSKKKEEQKIDPIMPQDLTKKPLNIMGDMFAQQLLKTPPKIDPAALYATQLALYRNTFPALSNWPSFPLNPLIFQSLQTTAPILPSQDTQEVKDRLQRYQLCGGSVIADNFTERLKNLQNFRPTPYTNWENLKEPPISPIKTDDLIKPKSLDSSGFSETIKKSPKPPDLLQTSPNSVKMVIKNGVLMPKQKQRRYRTERPFTCEHCSARFTLRSNMERHIKQQHPQFWSQRQRGHVGAPPGRKQKFCDLSIPNYEVQKSMDDEHGMKFAILARHLTSGNHQPQDLEEEDEELDGELVIDEEKPEKTENQRNEAVETGGILEEKLKELHFRQESVRIKEEHQDLVPVSRLLDNASQQPFKDYFKREEQEQEVGGASEEDEEGLVASGSTSEGNISGTDENR